VYFETKNVTTLRATSYCCGQKEIQHRQHIRSKKPSNQQWKLKRLWNSSTWTEQDSHASRWSCNVKKRFCVCALKLWLRCFVLL